MHLIVNADDFGYSAGVNRGIVECHVRGVVTSASLMVRGRAARDAVSLSREQPGLSIGLHWDWEDQRELASENPAAVRNDLQRQLEEFERLLGCPPTHVDSHHHVHQSERFLPVVRELVEPLGVPLRGDGEVRYVGGFYAQWEWKVTNLCHVSVEFLQRLLREEVGEGWTELSCHPGYVSSDDETVYAKEREAEIRTLTDPRVREAIDALDIRLAGFGDYVSCGRARGLRRTSVWPMPLPRSLFC